MFKVLKNKKTVKTGFTTYEQARQFARKQIRKVFGLRNSGQPDISLAEAGYVIRNV